MRHAFKPDPEDVGQTLAAVVRRHIPSLPWSKARDLIHSGRVRVDGEPVREDAFRVKAGHAIDLNSAVPRHKEVPPGRLVHDDAHVVVIDKPSGVNSVPYDPKESGTAMDLVRAHWRFQGRKANEVPLHIVHRIDKDTSGLLAFAITKNAEKGLGMQFRAHTLERQYLCVVHGRMEPRRIETELVPDRGDGIRGSSRGGQPGKLAITHVLHTEPIGEHGVATLCTVQLETGKTHQIRIHLAESGHPIIGETVYIRDYRRATGEPIDPGRLLLHAATLGFMHPITKESIHLEAPLPDDFTTAMDALAARGKTKIE